MALEGAFFLTNSRNNQPESKPLKVTHNVFFSMLFITYVCESCFNRKHLSFACRVCVQVGEPFGPVRALAEGKPGELFVGTTKNAIIRSAFPDTLTPIVQV